MDSLTFERLKVFIFKVFEKGGYSDSRWKNQNYDLWTTWFWIDCEDKILAAMRIIEKVPENSIPLEVAVIDNGGEPATRYAVIEENVADWNSVAFELTKTGAKAAKKTFRTVAKYCFERGFETVYGLYNPNLLGIEKLYLKEGAELSKRYSSQVYFPGFHLNGELAKFNVIELKRETLRVIASKL